MFKLESKRLKREFKIVNDNFFASQILNKYSNMSFVPDGNGSEFVVRFCRKHGNNGYDRILGA